MTSSSHNGPTAALTPTIVRLPVRGSNNAQILVAAELDQQHRRRPLKEALVQAAVLDAVRSHPNGRISTLVDVSAGSYGIALARYASEVGCQARVYVPAPAGEGIIAKLHAANATPVLVEGSVQLARDAARAFVARASNAIFLDQHGNFDLHRDAYAHQARLIADRAGSIDALISFAGTGGLISVFGEAVRRAFPDARLIRLQPAGDDWTALSTTFPLPEGCEVVDPSHFRSSPDGPIDMCGSPFLAKAIGVATLWKHGLRRSARILVLGTD